MTNTILRKTVRENFTIIENEMIQNPNLTNKAKGLWAYMMSMPDDWSFNITDLSKRSADGVDSIKSTLLELEGEGYIRRYQLTADGGRFGAHVTEVRSSLELEWNSDGPEVDYPLAVEPLTEKPLAVNPLLQSTQDTKDTGTEDPVQSLADWEIVWNAYHDSVVGFDNTLPEPRLTNLRRQSILRRLDDYSVEEMVLAVTGWTKSDFHRGMNEEGKVWCDFNLVTRPAKIEQFIGYHNQSKSVKRPKDDVNSAYGRAPVNVSDRVVMLGDDDDDEDFLDGTG